MSDLPSIIHTPVPCFFLLFSEFRCWIRGALPGSLGLRQRGSVGHPHRLAVRAGRGWGRGRWRLGWRQARWPMGHRFQPSFGHRDQVAHSSADSVEVEGGGGEHRTSWLGKWAKKVQKKNSRLSNMMTKQKLV